MNIGFLHIPKTAGQSIHQMLIDGFGEENVCPARVNEQLVWQSRRDLQRYRVFSGHFDWAMLDAVPDPKFVFTVLRDPMERVLSFYFYLRKEAQRMQADGGIPPEKKGERATFELSPREYFLGAREQGMRNFLDNLYDNFYTYYFAARTYDGRQKLGAALSAGGERAEQVYRLARDNLATLNGIYAIDQMDRVADMIARLSGKPELRERAYEINRNDAVGGADRLRKLEALGADSETLQRLQDFVAWDRRLMAEVLG